jgi:hypothetical protein
MLFGGAVTVSPGHGLIKPLGNKSKLRGRFEHRRARKTAKEAEDERLEHDKPERVDFIGIAATTHFKNVEKKRNHDAMETV